MAPIKIILFILLLHIVYLLISIISLSRYRKGKVLRFLHFLPLINLSEVKTRARITNSVIICFFFLFLPYTLRGFFIFILHFILNNVTNKIRLLFTGINTFFSSILLFFAYFFLIPVTVLIRIPFLALRKRSPTPKGQDINFDNIFRMF